MNSIPIIIFSVLLNAAAQIFLKQGMLQVGHFEISANNIPSVVEKVALNPFIWCGLASYVVSVVAWMVVLSRVEVSFAYPFLSIGYLATTAAAYLLFNEAVTWERMGGIGFIILGVILVSRS